jgi:hypothetical protein
MAGSPATELVLLVVSSLVIDPIFLDRLPITTTTEDGDDYLTELVPSTT